MQEWVNKHGFTDSSAMLDYAYALSERYGSAIGALACQMYEATAAAQGVTVNPAEAAATPEYGEVAKAVNGAKKQSEKLVPSTVGRLVKQVGADTTLKNAQRDGAQFAWVPHGDSCAFCLMLASRGWQYMSKKALKNGHAEHIHANCDCQYAVRFDGKSTVEGYDPDKYKEMYDSAEGSTPQEKLNSMRRAMAAEKKAVAKSSGSGIIETDQFHSKADPMVEVTGAGEASNPQEIAAFRQELKTLGVTLVEREEESLAYSPGIVSGQPGAVYVSKGASYSAWCHEMQHARDDYAAGWSGMRILEDPDARYEREASAYEVEIELARQAGRDDIVERLQENLEAEKRVIYGE